MLARIGESQFAALAMDAIEPSAPVLLQRLRKHLEALNRGSSRWGPLELRMAARFWAGKGARTFAEFLDEVEAGVAAYRRYRELGQEIAEANAQRLGLEKKNRRRR
jgi:hypothetical protein